MTGSGMTSDNAKRVRELVKAIGALKHMDMVDVYHVDLDGFEALLKLADEYRDRHRYSVDEIRNAIAGI